MNIREFERAVMAIEGECSKALVAIVNARAVMNTTFDGVGREKLLQMGLCHGDLTRVRMNGIILTDIYQYLFEMKGQMDGLVATVNMKAIRERLEGGAV